MLKNLYIENVALISKINLPFEKGLSVLSGETGAGKSIIVDALAFVLGGRADKSLIKSGEEKAFVEAVFEIESGSNADRVLTDLGFDTQSECVVCRSLTENGKNEIRVNGRVTTLSVLKQITAPLADIFGQSEQTHLLKSDNHINILDGFKSSQTLFANVKQAHSELKSIENELKKFGGSDAGRERELDMLRFQIAEIEGINPSIQDEEELLAYKKKAMNAQRVSSALNGAIGGLGEGGYNAVAGVSLALNSLSQISSLDKQYESAWQRLESCKIELKDILDCLQSELESFDFDADKIDQVEERLDKIKSLKRKYGGSIQSVLEFLEKAKQSYEALSNADELIAQLNERKAQTLKEAYAHCRNLTDFRKKAAAELEQEIMRELSELGMKGAAFEVHFKQCEQTEEAVTANGWDSVEFLFSANKGEPLKPLAKIASGGEMSRFMLAVKNITAKIEKIPTMIFDEIDSGVSGTAASVVAKKLAKISNGYQAVVITHLPQIACMADTNYLVQKHEEGGKTQTTVKLLDKEGKVAEVKRLAGGFETGLHGSLHATEMVDEADKFKLTLQKTE